MPRSCLKPFPIIAAEDKTQTQIPCHGLQGSVWHCPLSDSAPFIHTPYASAPLACLLLLELLRLLLSAAFILVSPPGMFCPLLHMAASFISSIF